MVEQLSTEKLSKSTFMQVFRAKAFTSAKQIDGKDFIGNPASVVICNHHLPSNEEMRKIAISEKSPMTAFVLHQSGKQFQIRFFTPAGEEFGLCGHATLVAAHFIYQLYGLEEASFFKKEQLIIQSKKSNHGFKVRLPAFESESLENAISKVYLEDFGLLPTDLEAAYYCKKINDVFLILKTAEAVRKAVPNYTLLKEILAKENIRGVFLTALSSIPNIDYEVRIFAPHLGINEDISCGSANCSLLPLWSTIINKPVSNGEYTILCPYNSENNKFGGIEEGTYFSGSETILIGGRISG